MFESLIQLAAGWILPGIFFWFVLSLLAAATQEGLADLLKWRAKYLREAINNLLGDGELTEKFYDHPLIIPLAELNPMRKNQRDPMRRRPSYISPRLFAQVILDWVVHIPNDVKWRKGTTMLAQLRKNVQMLKSDHAHLAQALEAMLAGLEEKDTEKANTLTGLQADLENWFNDAMEVTTRLYKRQFSQGIFSFVAIIIAFYANFDAFSLTTQLWRNSLDSNLAAGQADVTSSQQSLPIGWNTIPVENRSHCIWPPKAVNKPAYWTAGECRELINVPRWGDSWGWFIKFFGILVGGILISFGSQFSFDLLFKKKIKS